MVEVYQEEQQKHYKDLLFTAWHIEAFARQKRLQSLKNIYAKMDAKKEQTDEDMFRALKEFVESFE